MLRLPIRSTTHTQLLDHAVPKTHCTYKVYRPSFLTTGLQGSRRRFSWDLPGKEFKELRAIKDFNAQPLLIDGFISLDAALPVVVGALLTLAAVKFISYTQLEVARTALLTRHVAKDGATVLQLGGTTRDLFYYPSGTIKVTVTGKNMVKGLWEQAALQSKVPIATIDYKTDSELSKVLDSFVTKGVTFDSVVAFDTLQNDEAFEKNVDNVWKLLKPGGTFLFLQPKSVSDFAERVAHGPKEWATVNWDQVASPLNPQIVGVAVKPLTQFSVDGTAFEQVMKQKRGKSARSK